MKREVRLLLIFLVSGLFMAVAGGGAMWWLMKPQGQGEEPRAAAKMQDPNAFKYINLEKVVVMLRGAAGEPLSHYMAMDLVFKAPIEHEKAVKQHLPLLRSIAVKAMSAYTLEKATMMTVDEFAADINAAYRDSYAADRTAMPFVEAMIGKLIIE